MTCASRQRRPSGAPARSQSKTGRSSAYTPYLGSPGRRGHGYFAVASSTARVRLSPAGAPSGPRTFASSRVSVRSVCALPSKPPHGLGDRVQRGLPVVPERRVAGSWASPAASTTSGSQPRAAPSVRAIWATSSEWVSRVRGKSAEPASTTWVVAASRRSAEECSTRARSRSKSVRGTAPEPAGWARLPGSGTRRARSCSPYATR